jgi:antitoxin CptB
MVCAIMSFPENQVETVENKRRKLRFRAWHRGTREMDLILGSFADLHIAGFDEGALSEFEKLLECPDPDLYEWVSGQSAPPESADSPVLRLLLSHRFAR